METCSAGDLRHRLDTQSDNEAMQSIATSFNDMLDELEGTIARVSRFATNVDDISSDVQTSASEVRRASEEVSESMQEISDGSTSQTEDLGVAADEINDLSATVEEVASTTTLRRQLIDERDQRFEARARAKAPMCVLPGHISDAACRRVASRNRDSKSAEVKGVR